MISQDMLALTPVIYGNDTKYYFGAWNQNSTDLPYLGSMLDSPGLGVRCVGNIDIFEYDFFRIICMFLVRIPIDASPALPMEHWTWKGMIEPKFPTVCLRLVVARRVPAGIVPLTTIL